MMKTGDTKVPIDRIPALASALEIDECRFLMIAIGEYHPKVHEVLVDVLGLPLSEAEIGFLTLYRIRSISGEIEISEPFSLALEGLLELAAVARFEK